VIDMGFFCQDVTPAVTSKPENGRWVGAILSHPDTTAPVIVQADLHCGCGVDDLLPAW
jgi:hypothetical protein